MKVIITGGTGFIGLNLALKCKARGDEVTVFGFQNTAAEADNQTTLLHHNIQVLPVSVTDRSAVFQNLKNADVVFHLAAAQHEMNVNDQHFRDVNVEGTRNVLDACVENQINRVLHGSTIGVYGKMNGLIDESSPCHPDNIYGITKLEGERVALSYSDRIQVCAIRIPETYGPGDRRLLKLFKTIQKNMFFIIGHGENEHHLVFIEDLIEGFFAAVDNPNSNGNVYVLAGPDPITTNLMVDTISNYFKAKGARFRSPLFPFLFAATVLEFSMRPLGIQPPLHRRRMDFFRKSYRFATQKAKSELAFVAETTFDVGVAKTAEWYLKRNLLPGSQPSSHADGHSSKALKLDLNLSAQIEPFDSFWEAPSDIEKGYDKFGKFYKRNYFKYIPRNRNIRALVISCGTGYLVELMKKEGYTNVLGIDSDQFKIDYATGRGLNCRCENAFPFLVSNKKGEPFDLIFAEQEINHLTKSEMIDFLELCRSNLRVGGCLIVHSLNGANPITGSEALAQNFDHYNTLTEYSLKQVLTSAGFTNNRAFPLNLYIFYENPINYIGLFLNGLFSLVFRLAFIFYGKENKIFTKKFGAIGFK